MIWSDISFAEGQVLTDRVNHLTGKEHVKLLCSPSAATEHVFYSSFQKKGLHHVSIGRIRIDFFNWRFEYTTQLEIR